MQPVGIGVAEPDILAQGCGGAGVVPVDELVARLGVPVPDVLKVLGWTAPRHHSRARVGLQTTKTGAAHDPI